MIENPKVFIQGPNAFPFIRMFLKYGYLGTTELMEADLVCYTGGSDIDPELYHEDPEPKTKFDTIRDKNDLECWKLARMMGIFQVGVCRGAQLLNVMCGGTLWQDVDNHQGKPHDIVDEETGLVIKVTSLHHQQMIPAADAEIMASCRLSTEKIKQGLKWSKHSDPTNEVCSLDCEVLYYDDWDCLCFQPHPEFTGQTATADYFFNCLEATAGFKAQRKE